MDPIANLVDVKTRQDLARFILLLKADLEANPDSWENISLEAYLDAVAAWVDAMDQAYKNQGEDFSEDQPWKLFAQILMAGKYYE